MPRFSLLKLADEALLPVFLILGARFAGIFIANLTFNLDWGLDLSIFAPSRAFIHYENTLSYQLANDFAAAATFLMIGLCMSWVLYRFLHLRLEKSHPGILQRLLRSGKEELLASDFEIYHQLVVWTALSWFVFTLTLFDYLAGGLSTIVFAFCLGIFVSLVFLSVLGVVKKD